MPIPGIYMLTPPASPPEPFPTMLVVFAYMLLLLAPFVLWHAVGASGWPRRKKALLCAATVLVGLFAAYRMPVALVPDSYLVMQDGTSLLNIMHVYGGGVHSSPFTSQLAALVSDDAGIVRLPALIRTNRTITIAVVPLFYLISSVITGSLLLPLPLTWVLMNNRNTSLVSMSEYPGPSLSLIFLLTALAGLVLARRRETGPLAKTASIGLIAVGTVLATGFRPEAGAVMVIALAAAAVAVFVSPRLIENWRLALRNWLAEVKTNPREGLEAALILVVVWISCYALESLLKPPASWFAGAFNPFNHGLATIPVFLMTFLAAPLVVLSAVGIVVTLRHPIRWLMLPASAILLLKLHVAASGSEFNHWFRLFSIDVPLVMLLAAAGLGHVSRRLEHLEMHKVWLRLVQALLALSVLMPIATSTNPGNYRIRPELTDGGLTGRNPQIEVRYLIKVLQEWPQCIFETRIYDHGKYRPVWFGRNLKPVDEEPDGWKGCSLVYLPLDCNFRDGPDCRDMLEGTAEINSLTFEDAPYGQVSPYLDKPHKPSITIGIYRRQKTGAPGLTDQGSAGADPAPALSQSANDASSAL